MKRTLYNFTGIFLLIFSPFMALSQSFTDYVDPFIGTAGQGHAFPGASLPFGMVQLNPDTGIEGYHSSDRSIMGFSQTDLGNVLLMPYIGDWQTQPGSKENPDAGYRSRFKQASEIAQPGYYNVLLEDDGIQAELTATLRAGFHKYTFPASAQSNIIIDLEQGITGKAIESSIKIVGDNEVTGMRRSKGWAADQYLFFVARFSKPFSQFALAEGNSVKNALRETQGNASKALLRFNTKNGEVVLVKVGISTVSIEGAQKNLAAEIDHWNFEKTKKEALEKWETELGKIEVEGGTAEQKEVFYTALYHTMMHPNLAMDVDGKYRGMDTEVHVARGFGYYNLFPLGTFQAVYPLFELIQPNRNADFVQSLLVKYQQSGQRATSYETNTMIVPIVSSFLLDGNEIIDENLAYKSIVSSAMSNGYGLELYRKYGYIPREKESNPVGKTLEYAYNDWCIAQVAKMLDKEKDYVYYLSRSLNYRHVFDTTANGMRGRDKYGIWDSAITKGNLGQYTFFAPHDINGLMDLMGGEKVFADKLDAMFNQQTVNKDDVTGLIGQYAHGNEGSHHVAYLYNYAGQPWKTQSQVRNILDKMYTNKRDGLIGTENCGQMAAWYVFSAMGFYPVNPVSGQLVLGSPLFEEITINLPNGEKFKIEAKNADSVNKYIQYAELNRNLYSRSYINQKIVQNGGKLFLKMVGVPSYEWAIQPSQRAIERAVPKELDVMAKDIVLMPYDSTFNTVFQDSKLVNLQSESAGAEIHYSLNSVSPGNNTAKYTSPIKIDKSLILKAIAIKDSVKSEINVLKYVRAYLDAEIMIDDGKSDGFESLLTDSEFGSSDVTDGEWLAIQNESVQISIDLGKLKPVTNFRLHYMRKNGSATTLPLKITLETSADGENYAEISNITSKPLQQFQINAIIELVLEVDKTARYFRLKIENSEKEPSGDSGAGLFIDEIMVEY